MKEHAKHYTTTRWKLYLGTVKNTANLTKNKFLKTGLYPDDSNPLDTCRAAEYVQPKF